MMGLSGGHVCGLWVVHKMWGGGAWLYTNTGKLSQTIIVFDIVLVCVLTGGE